MPTEPDLRSIVAVRATIPDDSFTAAALGTVREGSGVVIGERGLVLTIGYLITEAEEVWLTRQDGRVVPAHALAYDQETGFGLVQALGQLDLPKVEFGESTTTRLGDPVVFADGTGRFVNAAIVAKQEFAGYWEYLLDEAIFISPAHPSWGGAALLDRDGKLIGVGSLRLQMVSRGGRLTWPRPWLGVFSAESDGQVVVMSVAEGGPAEKAGLKRGDVISDVRDGEVGGLAEFYREVWRTGPAGAEVPMRIVREGRDSWLRVKSADRNDFLRKPHLQ